MILHYLRCHFLFCQNRAVNASTAPKTIKKHFSTIARNTKHEHANCQEFTYTLWLANSFLTKKYLPKLTSQVIHVFALYLCNKGAQRKIGATAEKRFLSYVGKWYEQKIPGLTVLPLSTQSRNY